MKTALELALEAPPAEPRRKTRPLRPAEASREGQARAWRETLGREWPEAEIVAPPVRPSELTEPRVLVRRRQGRITNLRGEELVVLDGLPAISLFTGCGGFDLGLERAGFCPLVQHEWAEAPCQTLIGNRPRCFRHAALIQGDLRQTPTTMLLREAGLYLGECGLLVGGPPCQGFSTANSGAWIRGHDERNDLVFEFLRVVREAQPRFFTMENVPGFTRFNGGDYLRAFLAAAWAAGYELVYGLVNAVEYMVPQDRCRFICMGTRRDLWAIDGILGALPAPVCFGARDLKRIHTLERRVTPEAAGELRRLRRPPGIRYYPERPVLFPPDPQGPNEGRSQAFHAFYDRVEATEPDRIVRGPLGGDEEEEA